MAGYTKNIAVIKGLKSGFSADGGTLSGLIKAEKYGGYFRAEISLINFAPLTDGRYVIGITDGENTVVCEKEGCECESEIDTSCGFAALVCFVCGDVSPVAAAVCGDFNWAVAGIAAEVERQERVRKLSEGGAAYEDEAIAEVNYYEFGSGDEGSCSVCKDKEQKDGRGGREDEVDSDVCAEQANIGEESVERRAEDGGYLQECGDFKEEMSVFSDDFAANPEDSERAASEAAATLSGRKFFGGRKQAEPADANNSAVEDQAETVPLAENLSFYERMSGEIERLLADYPHEESLEKVVSGSRWVRITYGGGRFYVFGVIYDGESPSYICYGVPSSDSKKPPQSLKDMAGFIPAGRGGFWVMYQDAKTGAGIKLNDA